MTQEEKQLLLKDLCARLPYEVIIEGLEHPEIMTIKHLAIISAMSTEPYKLYLRPMSSIASLISAKEWTSLSGIDLIDWYNANHIDYRGLIEKGLALEAPKDMYKEWISIRGNLKEDKKGNIVGGLKL